jgi:hypothetical protein
MTGAIDLPTLTAEVERWLAGRRRISTLSLSEISDADIPML